MFVFFFNSYVYYGEYPLSFAACLGELDMVKYLQHRNACPNKQDSNGNTVLHLMVIHHKAESSFNYVPQLIDKHFTVFFII